MFLQAPVDPAAKKAAAKPKTKNTLKPARNTLTSTKTGLFHKVVFNAYAIESAQTAVRYDARLGGMYERLSRGRDSGCAVVTVAHEMGRIMYFMLVREEPYRGENRGLTERKLKNMSKKAYDGLRN